MTKKLIYSFYVSRESFHQKINEIHFRCLERFKDSFDCVDITFISNNREEDAENIICAERRFLGIFNGKDIAFSIIDNNEFRESLVFYNKIATRLNDNELVFFGHNKGVSNVGTYNEKQVFSWVCGMYYYSLNYPSELDDVMTNQKYYSFGSFLTKNYEPEKCNKYGWYYIGTFFWINCVKLRNYIRFHNIEIPELADRFYDEEFLGNIIDTYPLIMSGCHNGLYLENCYNYYKNTIEYMKLIYDTKADGFDDFYAEMTK